MCLPILPLTSRVFVTASHFAPVLVAGKAVENVNRLKQVGAGVIPTAVSHCRATHKDSHTSGVNPKVVSSNRVCRAKISHFELLVLLTERRGRYARNGQYCKPGEMKLFNHTL